MIFVRYFTFALFVTHIKTTKTANGTGDSTGGVRLNFVVGAYMGYLERREGSLERN